MERFYPRLRGKVSVVYCGNKFPLATHADYRDRRDFVFVGTLEPGKNLDLILKAFAAFSGKAAHRLKVVGAMGWKQSHISGLLDSLALRDRVDFLGYIPDEVIRSLYRKSVALVMASAYEGFGLPVIEAMACGCPVIVPRNSALVEAGGEAALFFETNDVAGLTGWMERLVADPGLGKACVEKGLAHAAGFTWERTARETAAIYERSLEAVTPKAFGEA